MRTAHHISHARLLLPSLFPCVHTWLIARRPARVCMRFLHAAAWGCMHLRACVRTYACVHARMSACRHLCACARACLCVCARVFAQAHGTSMPSERLRALYTLPKDPCPRCPRRSYVASAFVGHLLSTSSAPRPSRVMHGGVRATPPGDPRSVRPARAHAQAEACRQAARYRAPGRARRLVPKGLPPRAVRSHRTRSRSIRSCRAQTRSRRTRSPLSKTRPRCWARTP